MRYQAVIDAREIADSKMGTFREAMRIRAEQRAAKKETTSMRLKSWTHFFQAIKRGEKTHDLRSKKDREFHVGQILTLEEYDNVLGEYTGDAVDVEVTYITDDVVPCAFSSAVLDKGYCILSIRKVH